MAVLAQGAAQDARQHDDQVSRAVIAGSSGCWLAALGSGGGSGRDERQHCGVMLADLGELVDPGRCLSRDRASGPARGLRRWLVVSAMRGADGAVEQGESLRSAAAAVADGHDRCCGPSADGVGAAGQGVQQAGELGRVGEGVENRLRVRLARPGPAGPLARSARRLVIVLLGEIMKVPGHGVG